MDGHMSRDLWIRTSGQGLRSEPPITTIMQPRVDGNGSGNGIHLPTAFHFLSTLFVLQPLKGLYSLHLHRPSQQAPPSASCLFGYPCPPRPRWRIGA